MAARGRRRYPEAGIAITEDDKTDSSERRFVHRETVALAFLIALAIGSFFVTRAAAMANRRTRRHDAAAWYARGRDAMASAHPDAAVAAFRRATAVDRDPLEYRLALAGALTSAHEDEAARQILLGARDQVPENPGINLQLARIEARRGDAAAAENYYHNALYGSWTAEDQAARRDVRAELVRHLLAHGDTRRALAELIILGGNLPDEPAAQTAAARMFFDAGDPRQALEHFNRALARAPDNGAALAGAGEAAFALQDYPLTVRYLRAAPPGAGLGALRSTAEDVLSDDPLRARLSTAVRRQRALRGLAHATARLDACASGAPDSAALGDEVNAMARALTPRALQDRPDIVDDAVGVIVRAMRQVKDRCSSSPEDRAWLLIGRLHSVETQ